MLLHSSMAGMATRAMAPGAAEVLGWLELHCTLLHTAYCIHVATRTAHRLKQTFVSRT